MTTDTVTVKHTWRQEGTIMLRDDERIDDLQRNHYGIIQRKGAFCCGMDAVLLSGFAVVKKGEKVLDLGTGTGIIPILLTAKTEGSHFTGLEIQEESADMARRSGGCGEGGNPGTEAGRPFLHGPQAQTAD